MSILDYLLNQSSEENYLAKDPFYNAARGMSQVQIAPSSSNLESFLLPFLQHTGVGALAGYGKSRAKESQYQDISKMLSGMNYQPASSLQRDLQIASGMENPIDNLFSNDSAFDSMQYGLESAPKNYGPNIGLTDLLLATTQQQAQQEANAKTQALYDQFELENSLPYREKIKREELLKAQGKAEGERLTGGLTTDQQLKLETDITNKLSTGSEAQKVLETQSKAKNVLEALKKDDPIRAATAIYGFAKLLDPEGVVRKEDGSIVANPGGPAGQLASYYNTLIQKGQLTEQTKTAMREIIPSLVKNQYSSYDALKDTLIGSGVKQGARKEMIGSLPNMEFEPNVPPGYKLQRNKTTGETRIVPQ